MVMSLRSALLPDNARLGSPISSSQLYALYNLYYCFSNVNVTPPRDATCVELEGNNGSTRLDTTACSVKICGSSKRRAFTDYLASLVDGYGCTWPATGCAQACHAVLDSPQECLGFIVGPIALPTTCPASLMASAQLPSPPNVPRLIIPSSAVHRKAWYSPPALMLFPTTCPVSLIATGTLTHPPAARSIMPSAAVHRKVWTAPPAVSAEPNTWPESLMATASLPSPPRASSSVITRPPSTGRHGTKSPTY